MSAQPLGSMKPKGTPGSRPPEFVVAQLVKG
jgi:hypothetical protein